MVSSSTKMIALALFLFVPSCLASMQTRCEFHGVGSSGETQTYTAQKTANDAALQDTIHNLWMGLDGGMHSKNYEEGSSSFGNGVQLNFAFAEFSLSDNVRLSFAVRYWHARSTREPRSAIDAKGVEIGLPARVADFGRTSLSFLPSLSFEGVSNHSGSLMSWGIAAMAVQPLVPDKLELRMQAFARGGFKLLDLGGGFSYRLFGASLGIHVNLASFVTIRH